MDGADGAFEVSLTAAGTGAQCVAADPSARDTVYAGSRGHGLLKTADAGDSWDPLDLPANDVFSIAVSAADGAVYAGCEPSQLFRSDDGGTTWRELDSLLTLPSAPTWSFPPRPWTSHVRWIAPSPHDARRLLVGIELGGVMLSDDGGESWADHRPGAQRDAHALAWHPTVPDRAYEAGGGGAAWSFDGGSSWRAADAGRDRDYVWGLAVDPEDADRWYVSASPGAGYAHGRGSAEAYVYRWGSGRFEALGGGLPQPLDSLPYALTFAGGRLFAGLGDGRVYASADRGDSWRAVELTGERLTRVVALAEPTAS